MHKTVGDGTKTTKLLTVCFSDLQHLSRCCLILQQIQASVQIHFSLARIQLCVFLSPVFYVCCCVFLAGRGGQHVQRWERSSCVLEGFLCTKHVARLASKPLKQCRTQPVEAGCSQAGLGQAGLGQARPGQDGAWQAWPGVFTGVSPAGLHGPRLLCLLLTR